MVKKTKVSSSPRQTSRPLRGGQMLQAILDDDIGGALELTCQHLHHKSTDILEDEWIMTSAYIGKTVGLPFGRLWNAINIELWELVDADIIHVGSALLCTAKLVLLYKRCKPILETNKSVYNLHVATLRSKVIRHFPEDADLSPSGLTKFASILPLPSSHYHSHSSPSTNNNYNTYSRAPYNDHYESDPDNDSADSNSTQLYDFCKRMLAGLSKLMTEKRLDDVRYSMEYLSKKKLAIPVRGVWPAPNSDEAEKGHMCWFLWGALACFHGKSDVSTYLRLFTWNWRPSPVLKAERLGLLLGFIYTTDMNVSDEWTYGETTILDNIEHSAADMWQQFREARKDVVDDDDEGTKQQDVYSRMDMFCSYIPRPSLKSSEKQSASLVSYDHNSVPSIIYNNYNPAHQDPQSDTRAQHLHHRVHGEHRPLRDRPELYPSDDVYGASLRRKPKHKNNTLKSTDVVDWSR